MSKSISISDIDALSQGAAFLGSGGGGDPYIGALLCKRVLEEKGSVELIDVSELRDSDGVYLAAMMGAPTVMIEKLFSIEGMHRAVSALEAKLGRAATAIMAAEIGGINALMPVAYAAHRGLPVVDADGMGRAFPNLDLTTFSLGGVSCTPMTIVDDHENIVAFETSADANAERLARPVVAEMGASVSLSCYPMTGAQVKKTAVRHTLSASLEVGRAILDGREAPVAALLAALSRIDHYKHAYRILSGKVADVRRNTAAGWVSGSCTISALREQGSVEIIFQNENLVLTIDGEPRVTTPDLICIVDDSTAQPITTERLRYGQRVSVIACSAPRELRTPQALARMGPAAFGIAAPYEPIERRMGEQSSGGLFGSRGGRRHG